MFLQKKAKHSVNKTLRPNEHFTEESSNIVNIGVIVYDDLTWFSCIVNHSVHPGRKRQLATTTKLSSDASIMHIIYRLRLLCNLPLKLELFV